MNSANLEIACFNLQSALIAQQGGADRIELCADFSAGGITPDYGTVETARKLISVDLFVMIRPRGGNFVYSDEELSKMADDILHFKEYHVNGFVFGILNSNGTVNKEQCKQLVKLAGATPCTFHRAFDFCTDLNRALEDVIECGFQTILTSGQASSAVDGISSLNLLAAKSKGRIGIMPGGGIRSSNIDALTQKVSLPYYHSSAILRHDIADLNEVRLLKEKLSRHQ
jgi:copper homeostasis protein